MKIGEFAEICQTKISVLRHYDEVGLLKPDFVDRFTSYRYYSAEQIERFTKITVLKKAGFSLEEIREILKDTANKTKILNQIRKKQDELEAALTDLDKARAVLLGESVKGGTTMQPSIQETAFGTEIRTDFFAPDQFFTVRNEFNNWLNLNSYQRISGFHTLGKPDQTEISLRVYAVKLQDKAIVSRADPYTLPFEADDVVGKWEIVGEYAVKEDFFSETFPREAKVGDKSKHIYFLPNGAPYWCYRWTKNFFICDFGDCHFQNHYTKEEHNGTEYLFIDYKSYEYCRGGRTTTLVLRRLDRTAYTAEELARKDNLDMPFQNDPAVLGTWKSVACVRTKAEFHPNAKTQSTPLYFKQISFSEGGACASVYGTETIRGKTMQTWTKGYVLRKWNQTACAYEIRNIDGTDYLFMEWKSGDYRWGGFDTDYYVFVRKD